MLCLKIVLTLLFGVSLALFDTYSKQLAGSILTLTLTSHVMSLLAVGRCVGETRAAAVIDAMLRVLLVTCRYYSVVHF